MTDAEHQQFQHQVDVYREKLGASTLLPYVGRGFRWLCKLYDDQGVVLVKLGSIEELTISVEDFRAEFSFYLLDEAVYYFGSKEAQAAADADLNEQLAAIKRCIESATADCTAARLIGH